MGVGASIFLIAVGWILAIVGLIGLVMTLFIRGPRRRARDEVIEHHRVRDDGV